MSPPAAAAQAADPADSLAAPATRLSAVVVTATRNPEVLDEIPADLSVVSGPELSGRDAHDMASALALVPGVEAPAVTPSVMTLSNHERWIAAGSSTR